ncbi:MAG: hypothetical protein AAF525_12515 [Pseudomonadota bacterium]
MTQAFDFKLAAFDNAAMTANCELLVEPGSLSITWHLDSIPALVFPCDPDTDAPGVRVDNLWEQTCFELFIRPEGTGGYIEVNISPTRDWNCYAFTGQRTGMLESTDITPTSIHACEHDDGPSLVAHLRHELRGAQRVGISAVVATASNDKYFLALHHPCTTPDFHHPDGHVIDAVL